MARFIEKSFPEAKGVKTRKGAEARIHKLERHVTQEELSNILNRTLFTIIERDGVFLPVAVLNSRNESFARFFTDNGICVIN